MRLKPHTSEALLFNLKSCVISACVEYGAVRAAAHPFKANPIRASHIPPEIDRLPLHEAPHGRCLSIFQLVIAGALLFFIPGVVSTFLSVRQ